MVVAVVSNLSTYTSTLRVDEMSDNEDVKLFNGFLASSYAVWYSSMYQKVRSGFVWVVLNYFRRSLTDDKVISRASAFKLVVNRWFVGSYAITLDLGLMRGVQSHWFLSSIGFVITTLLYDTSYLDDILFHPSYCIFLIKIPSTHTGNLILLYSVWTDR